MTLHWQKIDPQPPEGAKHNGWFTDYQMNRRWCVFMQSDGELLSIEMPHQPGDIIGVREATWFRPDDGITWYDDGAFRPHPTSFFRGKLFERNNDPGWEEAATRMPELGFVRILAADQPDWAIRKHERVVSVGVGRPGDATEGEWFWKMDGEPIEKAGG